MNDKELAQTMIKQAENGFDLMKYQMQRISEFQDRIREIREKNQAGYKRMYEIQRFKRFVEEG